MGVFSGPDISESGLVLAFDGGNIKSLKGEVTTNLIPNPTEEMPRGEFGQYRDLASIFDTNGLTAYSLSMDIKTNIPGNVFVYMQNGSYTKYGFVGANVYCTTEYQRFYFNNLTPVLSSAWQQNTPNDNRAILATYTGYGSGVNPTVKNIQLEQRSYSTRFVAGTRGATVATGGGWADLTGNANHATLVNGVRESSDNLGALVFDGTDDYVSAPNTSLVHRTSNWSYSCWVNFNGTPSLGTIFENGSWGNCLLIRFETNGFTIYSMSSYWGKFNLSPTLGIWYKLDFIRNGNSIDFYLNGVYSQSISFTADIQPSSNLFIGMSQHAAGQCFNGRIAQTQIYNRALTAAEIQQNFNATRSRFGI